MKIVNSSVAMAAQHQLQRSQHITPKARLDNTEPPRERRAPPEISASNQTESRRPQKQPPHIARFAAAGSLLAQSNQTKGFDINANAIDSDLQVMIWMLEYWTGHKIQIGNAGASVQTEKASGDVQVAIEQQQLNIQIDDAISPDNFRLHLREQELTTISIQADITLDNGEVMHIELDERLSRKLDVKMDLSANEMAKMMDPLVLNFHGPLALSENRFNFDLNGDGEKESLAKLASQSAYLALDKNGDGIINDGSELFGAITGNGFAELAVYDDDGNGFIDSADAVFNKLQLFTPGVEKTQSITSKGVEALYLGSTATPHSFTDSKGQTQGQLRSSSFFIADDGAHSFQQIDLVV